jgi:hypothetical protein
MSQDWSSPDPPRASNPYATPYQAAPAGGGPNLSAITVPVRPRRWGWVVATTLWALFSVVSIALLANRVWDGVSGQFGNLSDLAAGPMTPPLPEPTAPGMDTPAPIPAVDPRPAAAATWGASNATFGAGDIAATCRVFALGPGYMYGDRFECAGDLQSSYDGESLHDRKVEAASRIDPAHMVLLVDGSIAFRMQDVSWPAGLPEEWDATQDTSVQVLHQFPGKGWLQVGYLNQDQEPLGYVPQPLPEAVTRPADQPADGTSPGDVVPIRGADPRPAAAAVWNASLAGWTTGKATTLCRSYALGNQYLYASTHDCVADQTRSLRLTGAALRKAAAVRLDPARMVMLRDHSLAFVTPAGLVVVMREVIGQGWRVVGTQNRSGSALGAVPQPLSPSLLTPA